MADLDSRVRQRNTQQRFKPSWAKGEPDYDPDLPYGPNVYLARKKKPDSWWVKYVEVSPHFGNDKTLFRPLILCYLLKWA